MKNKIKRLKYTPVISCPLCQQNIAIFQNTQVRTCFHSKHKSYHLFIIRPPNVNHLFLKIIKIRTKSGLYQLFGVVHIIKLPFKCNNSIYIPFFLLMFLSVICQADSQRLILIVIKHIIFLPKCSTKAHKTNMP